MNPIQRLHDARLDVRTANGIYRIFKLAQGNESGDEYKFIGWNGNGDDNKETTITLADRRGLLYFENELWVFRVWDHAPGPGPDDFAYGFRDLEYAVQAVLDFYEGKPTRIDGWWIPLHRHPYLDPAEVRRVVMEATLISEIDFETLKKVRADQFALQNGNTQAEWVLSARPEAIMSLQYIQCVPIIPANSRLLLRRDAQEAFVVVYQGEIPPVSS